MSNPLSSSSTDNRPSASIGYVSEIIDDNDENLLGLFDNLTLNGNESSEENDIMDRYEVSKLGADNYSRWKIDMKDVLTATRLWKVVSGEDVKPTDPSKTKEIQKWIEDDAKAKHLIRKSLTEVVFNHTRDCETSKAIYGRIVELKEPKSVNVLLQSWQEFYIHSWKDNDDVRSGQDSL
jgi:hypothetical protein